MQPISKRQNGSQRFSQAHKYMKSIYMCIYMYLTDTNACKQIAVDGDGNCSRACVCFGQALLINFPRSRRRFFTTLFVAVGIFLTSFFFGRIQMPNGCCCPPYLHVVPPVRCLLFFISLEKSRNNKIKLVKH